jgi:hypothetical protein
LGEPVSASAQFAVTVALPLVVVGDVPKATLELRQGVETLKAVSLSADTPCPMAG